MSREAHLPLVQVPRSPARAHVRAALSVESKCRFNDTHMVSDMEQVREAEVVQVKSFDLHVDASLYMTIYSYVMSLIMKRMIYSI